MAAWTWILRGAAMHRSSINAACAKGEQLGSWCTQCKETEKMAFVAYQQKESQLLP